MSYDLPDKIQDDKPIFLNTDSDDCDSKLVTELSFSNGISKEFFLNQVSAIRPLYVTNGGSANLKGMSNERPETDN